MSKKYTLKELTAPLTDAQLEQFAVDDAKRGPDREGLELTELQFQRRKLLREIKRLRGTRHPGGATQ